MTSFGGAVKLTGESEYRAALRNITQRLKEVSSEMKLVASQYDKSDTSTQALTAKQNVLNEKLEQQKQRLSTLQAQYSKMSDEYATNAQKHEKLVQSYEEEKAKLEKIGQELGETSPEYKEQKQHVEQLAREVDKSTAAQDSNANAMSRMRTQINNAKTDINKTTSEIGELDRQLGDMSGAQGKAASEMERLSSTIEQQKSKLSSLKSEYANAVLTYGKNSSEAKKLGTEIKSLSSEVQQNESRMNAAKTGADNLAGGLDKLGNSASSAGNGGFTVLKGALANLAGNVIQTAISGIQDLAGEAIQSSDSLKKFESTMSFAGYDNSQIETAKTQMKDYADKTVYDLETVSNTTAQLAANGVPNFEQLTEAAGNLNAVAGGNQDTFSSVAMVLTQTAGAGKLTTENWNQLSDAIPGASGKLQEALKKNGAYTGNFRDAMEKGQITADEFNKAIMDLGFTDAAKQAATSTDTFEGAMGNMQAAVTDGLMQIYDAIGSENVTNFINGISDAVSKVIPPIKKAIQWFKDNLPTIGPLIAGIATALGGIMVAQKVEAMVTAFNEWKAATEGLTVAQRILNAVQLSSPIGLVIGLIAGVVAAIVVLWNTNKDFRDAVTNIWNGIKDFIGNAIQAIGDFFTNLGTTISQLPQMFADWLNNVISTVTGWASNLAQQAASAGSQFVSNVVSFVQNLPYNIGYLLGTVIGTVISWVSSFVQNARQAGSQFVSNVVNFIQQLPSRIGSFLSNVISRVGSWVSNMASNATRAGTQFNANVVRFIQQLPSRIGSFLSQVISRLASWAGQMAAKGADGAHRMFNAVVNGIKSLPSRVASIGGDIVHGIWNGISGAAGWLADKVKSFASGILDGMKNALGIHSPSRVFRDQVGKYIAQGIGVGFESEMGNVTRQMQDAMPDASVFSIGGTMESVAYQSAGAGAYGGDGIVDAVVEALGRVHIVLDDEVAGRFVERTVTNAIYA
jgi:tape measure domain-containing protein|nr:MAG TPA_asm: tail tape measure [Caudoviricetes sp.]